MTIDVSESSEIMQPLDKRLRRKLESVVEQARNIAEMAARSSLQQLGVGDSSPPSFLSAQDRQLRKRLRSHGRQLGDQRNAKTETQEIDRLAEEVAYEHWHRMLFARFLAENNLLMYPGPPPVSVNLEECGDLALEEGAKSGWELASRFATQMLPQIFRADSVVFEITLPPEKEQALEGLLADLPVEVFTSSDALGWIYQFWQSRRKEEVNASQVKIGAREIPSVTQLFTEPYMVAFLLDNSLGAWWANRRLTSRDLRTATTEDELRCKASIPGLPLKYLRFTQMEDNSWITAGGNFVDWPTELKDFKLIDPCCGSGHFLVAALLMLVPMRMELESLGARDAVDRVLSENIHGLEIDQRCVELAAFALALAAWRYPAASGYRQLPSLSLACSGRSLTATKEEWSKFSFDDHNLKVAVTWIHDTFAKAPLFGSLNNIKKSEAARLIDFVRLQSALETLLTREASYEVEEAAVAAHGLAKATKLLCDHYTLVITNVPYRRSSDLEPELYAYFERNYPKASLGLETVFFERCLELCDKNGAVAIVIQQNWLGQPKYAEFRRDFLRTHRMNLTARLGARAFQTISGEVVNVILQIVTSNAFRASENNVEQHDQQTYSIDAVPGKQAWDKAELIANSPVLRYSQSKQLNNATSRIIFEEEEQSDVLGDYAKSVQGIKTGDDPRFRRYFWENSKIKPAWAYLQGTVSTTKLYGGLESVVWWSGDGADLARKRGQSAWSKRGVAITQMSSLPASLYLGGLFDSNITAIVPVKDEWYPALVAFGMSNELSAAVRKINSSIKANNGEFKTINFNLHRWQQYADEHFPNGVPEPHTDDPTQWLFHGHPSHSLSSLQVGVARLLGYQWPAESDGEIELCHESELRTKDLVRLQPHVDQDGIVCIPAIGGELAAAERLHNLLACAYAADWSNEKLSELLNQSGCAGRSLEYWLREKFFAQHCEMFFDRPFIWHIWDGLRDGFAALVNYHKLDAKLLETLIYTYLGDWINRQKQETNAGVDGAHERLAAAEILKKRLELIISGEAPYDIFVRWRSIEQQPIGWQPDLNDGIRINIRPFLTVPDVGRKGTGVLRDRPSINWSKDRGKDTSSAPWYALFKGDRINDHHLSLAEKQAARAKRN